MPATPIPTPGTWPNLLAELEGAAWGVVCGSGMAAISAILLGTVQQNQRIVASNRLYGRTDAVARSGTEPLRRRPREFVDASDLDQVARPWPSETQILFVETMSNPLLRLVDIAGPGGIGRRNAIACWSWTTRSPRRC